MLHCTFLENYKNRSDYERTAKPQYALLKQKKKIKIEVFLVYKTSSKQQQQQKKLNEGKTFVRAVVVHTF